MSHANNPPQPGYFDLQVNGYAGVDFNDNDLTPEDLHKACQRMAADGNAGFLATFVTDHTDVMATRLANVVRYRDQDPLIKRMIPGIHIEGPFISPVAGYRGAHPSDAVRPADLEQMKKLLDAAGGLTKIVTLAPECDAGMAVTKFLAGKGVTVSGGHSDASLDDLRAGVDAGLSMWTHLGNGCPMQMHRHDNVVQRVLSMSDRITPTFIADAAHVALHALRNYIKVAGIDRCVVVTDAIALAGLGPGRFKVSRWDVLVGEDMVAWAPDKSHLVGSTMPMNQMVENLLKIGITRVDALRLTIENPRKFC